MGKSRFIELMAKSIGKIATEEELKELEEFLILFPEYNNTQNFSNALETRIKEPVEEKALSERLEVLWQTVNDANEPAASATGKNKLRSLITWKWTAAAAILTGIITSVFFYRTDTYAKSMHRIYVPYGKTKELLLSDGTKIKLNSGSTFSYPDQFSNSSREVSLTGEGFFEVAKNPKRPFLVHTNRLTVKVLGTVFNVKAYDDDKNIETTLLRGKVQIELKDQPEKKVILLPNEKIIVANQLPAGQHTGDSDAYQLKTLPDIKAEDFKETAWVSNRMVFTNESFDDVSKQIERKYNVKMIFEDPALETEQISGVLEKESLENALQIIKMTTPFKFRVAGRLIYISHK
jgi:transmembrane sensor